MEKIIQVNTGAEAFIELLNANGVEYMFLNPGTDTSSIQQAISKFKTLGKRTPEVILCLHESVAMAAAHGYFMVSGKPQVVFVHTDVGIQQAGGAVHNAQRGRIGVVLCSGRAPSSVDSGKTNQVHWFQEQFRVTRIKTISIGLACWPDDGISHTDIIAAADVTLYRAKRGGGNQSCQATGTLTTLKNIAPESNADNSIDISILEVIRALADTLDARSYSTFNHSRRVTDCALALGKALKMETAELSRLEACSLLHDIGKMSINEGIINKTADLSPEEWEIIKTHPKLGADIAGRTPQLVTCTDGILYHHEHYDGSGYPNGLAGEDIPLIARILAIADSYVAMTSERSYSGTMSHKRAIEALQIEAGKQFDPYLVEIFAAIEKINTEDKNKARR